MTICMVVSDEDGEVVLAPSATKWRPCRVPRMRLKAVSARGPRQRMRKATRHKRQNLQNTSRLELRPKGTEAETKNRKHSEIPAA